MLENIVRLSSIEAEGPFNASKWLKHQVILSVDEMQDLIKSLGHFFILPSYGPVQVDSVLLSHEDFLQQYVPYIESVVNSEDLDENYYRRCFCNYLTKDLSTVYAVPLSGERVITKVSRPVIQMQLHHFFYSHVDHKIHSMVMTKDSIHWGVQFSYPQIFEDPHTHEFFKIDESERFPNTQLFKNLVKWLRKNTIPTPIEISEKKMWAPFRIGKQCFSWINSHKKLMANNVSVPNFNDKGTK